MEDVKHAQVLTLIHVSLYGANIPSIPNSQKNLINQKVIPKKFYGCVK
jgi:hypothetical protein